ncbi:MAG: ferredoxin [Gammaproteobacteria bacterium]|nr:MAG: ferredoxin [Gammaproteobacteria bacterium]
MAQLISLSRAARLVGVKRATLQKQIREGLLQTFEGELDLNELLRLYPQTQVEDSAMLERADRIIQQAYGKVSDNYGPLPDIEVLAARVTTLSHELGTARAQVRRYRRFLDRLRERLDRLHEARPEDEAVRALHDWFRAEERELARVPGVAEEALATDAFLRIVAARVTLKPSRHEYLVPGSESLLQAGLRAGYALPYGCSDGSCGRCKATLVSGEVKPVHDYAHTLTEEDHYARRILMCANTALTDVTLVVDEVRDPGALPQQRVGAHVRRLQEQGEMLIVQLAPDPPARFQFLSGQHARITAGSASAECPLASCPCDETQIELHLGPEQAALAEVLRRGGERQAVTIEGPRGRCVLDVDSIHSLIFIAWDEHFAPIKSLIEQAVALETAESLHLYWITPPGTKPYLHNLCRAWLDALDHFSYRHLEVGGTDPQTRVIEALSTVAEQHYSLRGYDLLVAGTPELEALSRRHLVARGAPPSQVRVSSD